MEVDMQWMREKGDEFYHLTPEELVRWRAILGTSYDEWLADANAIGLPADEILNTLYDTAAELEANPYPEQDWFGPCGRYGSPNKPGGWD